MNTKHIQSQEGNLRFKITFVLVRHLVAVSMTMVIAVICNCTNAFAFTHDDSDTIYPELLVRFKAVPGKTAHLTMSLASYTTFDSTSLTWKNYTESVSPTTTSSSQWSPVSSILMRGGIPLEMDNVLNVTGNNVASYEVMINTSDPKYQTYIDGHPQLMTTNFVPIGTALNNTNHIMFFNKKRVGDNAGKVERISAGAENFRICLGNSINGEHLGHLTLRKRSEPWIADQSLEVGLYTVGADHYQVLAPQTTFDLIQDASGNYTINAYDRLTQPGNIVTGSSGPYIDFTGISPTISYTMNFTITTDTSAGTSSEVYSYTRSEGTSVMASKAQLNVNYNGGAHLVTLFCPGPDCIYTSFGTMCFPSLCSYEFIAGNYSFTNQIWDWKAQSSSQPSRRTQEGTTYTYQTLGSPQPASVSTERTVQWDGTGQALASDYSEMNNSGSSSMGNSYYFFSNLGIDFDGPSENQFKGNAVYNFISGFPTATGSGSHLKLAYQTLPNGGWEQYTYNDAFESRGMVATITRPFMNTPATHAASAPGSLVTSYTYDYNWDGSATLPSTVTETLKGINGSSDQVVSSKTYDYSQSYAGTVGSFPSGITSTLLGLKVTPDQISADASLILTDTVTRVYAISVDTSQNPPVVGLSPAKVWVTKQTSSASASQAVSTMVARYRDDDWPWLRDLPYYEINADGTQNDYIYQKGVIDYNTSLFQPSGFPDNSATANRMAFRSIKIKGSEYVANGFSAYSTFAQNNAEWFIQPIALYPGLASAEVRTMDGSGRLFSEENWIFTPTGFSVSTRVVYSYDAAGNVIAKYKLMSDGTYQPIYLADYTTSNGNSLSYNSIQFLTGGQYTGRKQYEQSEDGTIKKFYYDDYGRVAKEVQLASPTVANLNQVPANQTLYVYDADNRKINTLVGPVQSGLTVDPTAISCKKTYNLLGMVTSVTSQGDRATTYAYSNGGQTVTVTAKGLNNSAFDRTLVKQYYLDKQLESVSGNAVVPEFYNYSYSGGQKIETNYTGSSTGKTLQFTVTYKDFLGRVVSGVLSNPSGVGNLQLTGAYDTFGHLVSDSVSGLATELSVYNPYTSQMFASGLDMDGNGTLDAASNDRISQQSTMITYANSAWWEEAQEADYPISGGPNTLITSTTLKRVSSFPIANITILGSTALNMMLDSEDDEINAANIGITNLHYYAPGNALSLDRTYNSLYTTPVDKISLNGKLVCTVDSAGTRSDNTYDAYGRLVQITDRTGTAVNIYRTASDGSGTKELQYHQTPDGMWSQNDYDPAGRIDWVERYLNKSSTQPTGGGIFTRLGYNLRGQQTGAWGDIPFPCTNTYFEATDPSPELIGKLKQQTTYNGGASWSQTSWPGAAGLIANSTSYSYYPENGLLKTETHQKAEDNTTYTTTYTYDFLGRLSTRLTQRCITTTYAYVPGSGELQSVSYSPAGTGFQMSYSYDRMGHIQTVIDAAGTRTFHYRASDYQLDYEDLPSLTYGLNCSLNNLYDTHNRLDGHQFITPTSNNSFSSTYAFDSASGLLDIVATPLSTAPFAYTYTPNSHLVSSITCAAWPSSGATSFQILNTYRPDANRLQSTVTSGAGQVIASYSYSYDGEDRMQQAVRSGELFKYFGSLTDSFGYDNRDELTSANATATPNGVGVTLPDRAFGYTYDNSGNRNSASRAGQATTYVPNTLCQIASRAGSPSIPLSGLAGTGDSITLKNDTSSFQISATMVSLAAPAASASYYYGLLTYSGAAGPVTVEADTYNQSTEVHSQQQSVMVPAASESLQYDADGNLASDSLWTYSYDAEQRLIQMQTLSTLPSSVPRERLVFAYDFLGRRVSKQIYNGNSAGTIWTLADTRCWVYDTWNPIVEMDQSGASAPVPATYFAWGLDHSGTLQGAGGVGGLLGMITGLNTGTGGTYAAISDGLGNVTGLIDATNCNLVAEYEYSPFGELLRANGPMAAQNPLRFSSKYFDKETGLISFGFRYYSASLGRFISRDPKSEQGWVNLFSSLSGGGGDSWNYVGDLLDNAQESGYGGKDNSMAETTESANGYKDSSQDSAPLDDHKGDSSTMDADSGGAGDLPEGPGQMAGAPDWHHPYAFLKNSPLNDVEYMGLDDWDDFGDFCSDPNWGTFNMCENDFCADLDSFNVDAFTCMDDLSFGVPSSLYSFCSGSDITTGGDVDRSVAWNNFLVGGIELGGAFALGSAELAGESMAADAGSFEAGSEFAEEGSMAVADETPAAIAMPEMETEMSMAMPEMAAPEMNMAMPEMAMPEMTMGVNAPAITSADGNGGVDIALKYKEGWSDEQMAAADAKVSALNDAELTVSKVERNGTSAANRYQQAGGSIPANNDVDHVHDLQLGGADKTSNMAPLDKSVNRSLGAQIQQRIKNLPVGTRINRITISK